MHFVDREAKYPNRWTMKKSDGTSEVVTLVRNDEPIVEGTPMNAETLNTLSDVAGAEVARIEATKQAQSSAASAQAAAQSQTAAATSAQAAQTSAVAAGASAEKAAEEARKAANYVAADKTLSISGAPADAATVGNIILDRTKEPPQPIFYAKSEVDKLLEDCKEAAKRAALLAANPVGKLWVSDDPTSPASIVGGTWERIENRFIMGASDTYPAGATGGEESVKLTRKNIPILLSRNGIAAVNTEGNNVHIPQWGWIYVAKQVTNSDGYNSYEAQWISVGTDDVDMQNVNNMPPYIAVYIWRRVA